MKNFVLYIGYFKLKCLQKEIRFELNFFYCFSNKNCALILVKGFSHLEPSFTKIWPFIKKKKIFFKKFCSFCHHYGFSAFFWKFIFSDFEREFYCRSNEGSVIRTATHLPLPCEDCSEWMSRLVKHLTTHKVFDLTNKIDQVQRSITRWKRCRQTGERSWVRIPLDLHFLKYLPNFVFL